MEFVKAHGTGNDFVVVEDLTDRYRITPQLVRAVCDRHFGVGADGLIRIAPGGETPFFMDYRNADGSLAEMCGNGVRVVGKYLGDRGLVGPTLDLETRAGIKHLELHADDRGGVDRVTVDMGPPVLEEQDRKLEVELPAILCSPRSRPSMATSTSRSTATPSPPRSSARCWRAVRSTGRAHQSPKP